MNDNNERFTYLLIDVMNYAAVGLLLGGGVCLITWGLVKTITFVTEGLWP